MNKKFINLLLASVLTAGSVQVFTSCKDDGADLRNEFTLEYASLEARVKANEDALKALPGQLEALKNQLTNDINAAKSELQNQLNQFNTKFENALKEQGEKIDKVSDDLAKYIIKNDAALADLQTQITANLNKITNLEHDLTIVNGRLDALEAGQAILEGRVDALEGQVGDLTGRVSTLELLAAGLRVDVDALTAQLGDLTGTVNDQGARLLLVEGLLAQTKADLDQLTIDFNSYKGTTDGRLEALESFKTSWEGLLPQIQQDAAEALAKAKANEASIDAVKGSIATLNGLIDELKATDEELKAMDVLQQQAIDDILEKLNGFVSTTDFEAAIAELKAKDAELEKLAKENYTKAIGYTNLMIEQVLATMNTGIAGLQGQIDGMQGQIGEMQSQIGEMQGQISDLNEFKTKVNAQVEQNKQAIAALQNTINELQPKINELSDALAKVTDRIKEVADRITSIVLQGTWDEVFGSMRLPLGIQSNLLVSYFGEVANANGEVTFPLVGRTASTYDGQFHNVLTQEEADELGVSNDPGARVPIQTISGLFMKEAADGNGYLGKVYATINPSSVNVQDPKYTFNLVNSRGQKVAEPMTFVPSDKVLDFGYSRADNGNGFYEAEASVKVDESSINSIRFVFDDNLKSTVKDILKAPKASANLKTVAKLTNAVYEQLNGFLPAIGVEASWNDSQSGAMKVTSNYGIATATVKPLSFSFLYGVKPGKHIPHIMPALDKIQDKFNVVFDEFANKLTINLYDPTKPFTVGSVSLQAPNIQISLDPSTAAPVIIDVPEIWVTVPDKVDPETGEIIEDHQEKVFDGYKETIDIAKNINEVIDNLKASLETEFGKIDATFDDANAQLATLTDSIARQVNELLQNMQNTVDSTINDVLADIKNKVNGAFDNNTVNKIVNRLDGIISKLNSMMDNANYYLQPVLLYSNHGDFGFVSTSEAWPTVMVTNSNNNAIAIMPTTYTYETVVPAFKKYVAVTRVWKNGDKNKTNLKSIALEANDNTKFNTNMNKVINSNVREIALQLQKGYTYEVFYQAVDYSGYVSGRKYYICVQ